MFCDLFDLICLMFSNANYIMKRKYLHLYCVYIGTYKNSMHLYYLIYYVYMWSPNYVIFLHFAIHNTSAWVRAELNVVFFYFQSKVSTLCQRDIASFAIVKIATRQSSRHIHYTNCGITAGTFFKMFFFFKFK